VLVVLQHTDPGDTLKEDWYQLIAMVTGLASSIEASNIVVAITNAVAALFSCTSAHCTSVLLFCVWQIIVAVIMTVVFLPLLGRYVVAPLSEGQESSDRPMAKNPGHVADEKQPLLSV
jgi:hypothetical protein